jgi:prolyl-tRNA synthetase
MRMTHLLLPTEKQPPADAEALSHKLLVRAGLIRQLGAGLWSWLPAGWRAHQKAEQIIREEMDRIGAQEMLMPLLLPADMWKKTGRYGIDEMFKLQDRKGAEMVLALTHEEAVTTHVAQLVRSYRDLPLLLYHFQLKERDEPRPRAGVLRTREFVMKDAYSFDRDLAGLDAVYERSREAYGRIFDRAGLVWYEVESDVGMMGGTGAHEYMAPCAAGEDDVALAPGYAANVEIASADAQPVDLPAPLPEPEPVHTPGAKTVAEVAAALGVAPGAVLKAYPVVLDDGQAQLVILRGDHQVNELKLRNVFGQGFRPAKPDEIARALGPVGYIGPVGLGGAPVLLDAAVDTEAGWVTGANREDTHLRGVQPGRDFAFRQADVRNVEPGDTVDGQPIEIQPAIEIGNIFKLGLRYSQPLGATYLDDAGQERDIWMGSYGIGPARIVAASVEQYADDAGISWPKSLAPWDLELVSLGKAGTPERLAAEALYEELTDGGFDVLFDDRDAGPGAKFKDAELLGLPLRLTVGKRSLDDGRVEAQIRRGLQDVEGGLPLDGLLDAVRALWDQVP